MVAAAEPTTNIENPRTRQPWKPDGDAHLIFQWVKMEGKTQGWVAQAFGINQSTVSRIIQRYERWQAHAKEREDGRLDPQERLRAQRWLTQERNELILASCLRIAKEIEGFVDTSRSTVSHPMSSPSRETEVRTVHSVIDRTGTVSRFLRLAFKINMEQLKLEEKLQPPAPAPLSDEELAEQERQLAADEAELKAARARHEREAAARARELKERGSGVVGGEDSATMEDQPPPKTPDPVEPAPQADEVPQTESAGVELRSPAATPDDALVGTAHPTVHTSHNLHTESAPEIAATAGGPCRCGISRDPEKSSPPACMTDQLEAQFLRSVHQTEELHELVQENGRT